MPAKKKPAPQSVYRKLYQEQGECGACCAKPSNTPDKPRRDAHKRVQNRPDGATNIRRWCPAGTDALCVERAGLNRRSTTDSGGHEASRHTNTKTNEMLLLDRKS